MQFLFSFLFFFQEAGNVPYVTEGKFGVYTSNPKKIGQAVRDLLSNPSLLEDMGRRAQELSKPQATREIATDLAAVLLDRNRKTSS